jgi:hypothetical protein
MVEEDLGEATIAYEDPDEGTVERTVQNEHVAYFQDHWILKTDESDAGRDTVRRIPTQRVYYVERSVEEFEQEVATLKDQVQSFTDDLRSKLLGGGGSGSETGEETEPYRIEVKSGESEESGESSESGGSGDGGGASGESSGSDESDGSDDEDAFGEGGAV